MRQETSYTLACWVDRRIVRVGLVLWYRPDALILVCLLRCGTFFVRVYVELMPRRGAAEVSTHAKWIMIVQILTIESHDPVHNDIASLLTPRQLTRLSWP